jgi:Protein of unknown function (DUF2516)
LWWLSVVILAFKVFALLDAAFRREDAYRATGKQTKPFWLIILGLAVVLDIVLNSGLLSIFAIVGLVAAIVYVVDVRPAVRAVTPKRGKRKEDKRHIGPYGPW